MAEQRWRVRLSTAAELDLANILKWTAENFGARPAEIYRDTLIAAIVELTSGPGVLGSKARDDIIKGLRTLHVARHRRRGSHFVMYRSGANRTIEIVRILHERMDFRRHLLPEGKNKE